MSATIGERNEAVERAVLTLGTELWAETQGTVPGVFDKQFWAVKLLDWAMQDPDFKVDLFRLVDVLPALRSTEEIQACCPRPPSLDTRAARRAVIAP